MSETKEAIKLFGETIPLPETQIPANPKEKLDVGRRIHERSDVVDVCGEITKTETEDGNLKDYGKSDKSSITVDGKEDHQMCIADGDEAHVNPSPNEESAETSSTDQEKVIKKPDKIIPCPRCNSLETKFCYFNNYNVNQPRHFCKSCQRYWTAGGTMRNVPVGAGRRKNKHLASQYRQMLVSPSGVPITRIDVPDSTNQQLLSCGESPISSMPSAGNGTVLKFSSEGPLCESIATVLHLREQKNCAEMASARENGEELSSCSSSMTACNALENEIPKKVIPREQGGLSVTSNEISQPHPLHCHLVPPWVFSWNPGWNNAASTVASQCSPELVSPPEGSNPNLIQWCSTPMLTVPGFCTPNIPLQFVPASYWGCVPFWASGTRNIPFTGSNIAPSSSSFTNNSCSGNNLPILGKHSRDTNFMDEKSENCLLVPKTLRIDDPGEASKSSIWATFGFKSEQKETKLGGDISKPCKSSAEVEDHSSDTTQILEANPAALSRSQTFQERA